MGQMRRTLTSTMNYRLLFLLVLFSTSAHAQNWSSFLNTSRAVNWSSAGFSIPNYTVNCSTQPSLATGSGNAAANTTAIQNALNSCDSTHNVVNLPAGTYYTHGWQYAEQGHQVVRGAGANSTYIYLTGESCGGSPGGGVCMNGHNGTYDGSDSVLPPSGNQQCLWTGGLSQGSTSITLSSCPGTPPTNHLLILDQANDTSSTNGVYVCDASHADCGYEGGLNGNGRVISGVMHSQQQVVWVCGTCVTSLGGGSYTVTISPGVYFNNIRSGQSPGAWWSDTVVNEGVENMTLDGTSIGDHNINFYDCYECWVKGVRSIDPHYDHVFIYQSGFGVIRDSYFYQGQSHASESYAVEFEIGSGFLVENNIIQQTTNPIMFGAGTGNVIDYNYAIDDLSNYSLQAAYASHNGGNEMNLWEGNNWIGVWSDIAWGASDNITVYRNSLHGWQYSGCLSSCSGGTFQDGWNAIQDRNYLRAWNIVGNVLGTPGVQNQYQDYATSTSTESGGSNSSTSIYMIGTQGNGCGSGASGSPLCDPIAFSTMMRWGNYDIVNASVRWNSTEAASAAGSYLNANFTSSYFDSLAHALPASLYYSSTPSWWPSGKNWPAVGPDVTTGNVGICNGGTYAKYQATASGQCSGGSLTSAASAYASHTTSIPAMDCFLNTMNGPTDGTGSVLSFDASQCYASSGTSGGGTPPAPPTGLTASVN